MQFKQQLKSLINQEDDLTYSQFEQLLALGEVFEPRYKPQQSCQSSRGMRAYGGNFTS